MNLLLLLSSLALAQDPAPPAEPAPVSPAPPAAPAAEEEEEAPLPGAEVTIFSVPEVARARDALVQQLRAEGYRRSERKDGYTIYHHDAPYRPQVVLHDDGWIQVRRERIRIHAPGRRFANEGSPLEYLWCATIIALPYCISPGGQLISKTKLEAFKEEVFDATQVEVRQLNNAVAGHAMEQRLSRDIPAQLEGIWRDGSLPIQTRKDRILALWDTRTDTPEGDAAREAIENFMAAVIQTSATPYTAAELEAFNRPLAPADRLNLPAPR